MAGRAFNTKLLSIDGLQRCFIVCGCRVRGRREAGELAVGADGLRVWLFRSCQDRGREPSQEVTIDNTCKLIMKQAQCMCLVLHGRHDLTIATVVS